VGVTTSLRIRIVCLVVVLCSGTAMAADYYVDADSRGGPADDAGPGSLERPWRTLSRATADRELASGVYLYRLRTGDGNQTETRKMVLVR
jgi:hypothetical protein